jgi:DNA-binding transcriptional MerR regulator
MDENGHLKMKELAERSGVSPATIKHYLREGLLGEGDDVVRTSRNMAWYPPEYVERLKLIKRLQEDRYMPLKVIRELLDEGPERVQAVVEAEDRLLAHLSTMDSDERLSTDELHERVDVPQAALDRLKEIGVLTPTAEGYDRDDVAIIEAMVRFREGGYDESIGFTVYDVLRYQQALEPLVQGEVRVVLDRLAGSVPIERAGEIMGAGVVPVQHLLGALYTKLLLTELRRAHDRA